MRGLLVFLSLFAAKHGVAALASSVDSVQPGLFLQLLASTWGPHLPSVTGAVEAKLCAVAGADVLSQCTDLQVGGWGGGGGGGAEGSGWRIGKEAWGSKGMESVAPNQIVGEVEMDSFNGDWGMGSASV